MFERVGSHEVATSRKAAALGQRLDGRSMKEYQPIECVLGGINQASGSAQLRLGSSHVLVGIKAEVETPSVERPDEGRVCVGVQISPCAAPARDGRKLDEAGDEIAARLQRLLFGRQMGGAGIDLKSLNILDGRSCWVIYVDCVVLSIGGSLVDALSFGIHAALSNMRLPKVQIPQNIEDPTAADIEVDEDPQAVALLDVTLLPVVLGVCQVGKQLLLGGSALEEHAAHGRLLVSVNQKGQVCGIQTIGQAALDVSMLIHMTAAAQQKGQAILESLQLHLAKEGDSSMDLS